MRYLIYLRVSTKKQDEETQLMFCLDFIKKREEKEFNYLVFRDKLTSKKPIDRREGGQALLDTVQKGDIIIAMRLDRISRNLYETTKLIDVLDKKEADILLVEQPGITNKIMLGLYAGMAEEEVKLLRKRVIEKVTIKKRKGERYSRYLPYGYGLHETKLVPVKVNNEIVLKRGVLIPIYEEQVILKEMRRLFSLGFSYQKISDCLADQGYLNREERPFHRNSICRILSRKEDPLAEKPHLQDPQLDLFVGR